MKKKYFSNNTIRKVVGLALLIYLLLGWIFYVNQERFLFKPTLIATAAPLQISQAHQEISIPINQEDTIHITRFTTKQPSKGAILYFHGNRQNVEWYAKYSSLFTNNGYEVFMLDYPGYGKSRGLLTEEKIYQWSDIVYSIARKSYTPSQLIIYGKSLGSGIAAQLAAKRDCRQLVLETPYYDFPAVLSFYAPIYPFQKLLHYQFPTHIYLKEVTAPVLVLHGTADGVVRYSNSIRLAKQFKKGDELITIEGGSHNDLVEFSATIAALKKIL